MTLRKESVFFDSDNYFDTELDGSWSDYWAFQITEGYYTEEELDEDTRFKLLLEQEEMDWYDLKCELKAIEKALPHYNFLVIGSIGRWNGDFEGWKLVDSLEDAIYMKDCDYMKIWYDKDGLHIRGIHHDGSNEVTVWGVRPDVDVDILEDWLYECKHKKLWYKCDNLAPYISAFFGHRGKFKLSGIEESKIEKVSKRMKGVL